MDIKLDRDLIHDPNHPFEVYASEKLEPFFNNYRFLQTVNIYLRGQKHPYKKVKISVKLKGKEVFTEARGEQHHDAFDAALQKLKGQLEKYKSKRYNTA